MEHPSAVLPWDKRHRRTGVTQPDRRRRPYPLPPDSEGDEVAVLLLATKALLRVATREDVALVLQTAAADLGGVVVPAATASSDALPVDVSLGAGEPAVVEVPDLGARRRLARHLAELANDAQAVVHRIDVVEQQTRLASVDALTGTATRREIGIQLGLARTGDAVCILDLDGFKRLNDERGHAAGDDALRDLGRLVRSSIRSRDFVGRYGGDEFVLLLGATAAGTAAGRMSALIAQWRRLGVHGTTASAGVAVVDERGGAEALRSADAALYEAKRTGRDRVVVAAGPDAGTVAPAERAP